MGTKREGDPCWDKAGMDEPVFVLRASDVLAPEVVSLWAHRAEAGGTPKSKVRKARMLAARMLNWQAEHGAKHPD